jgi:hypothetical protein
VIDDTHRERFDDFAKGSECPMWFQTVPPDPVNVVRSVLPGYWYRCPDVAAVDRHLAELCAHLGPLSGLTESRRAATRADIDRLLDERAFLKMTEPPKRVELSGG